MKTKRVKAAYRFENDMVMAFDYFDEQIPDLQGQYSPELLDKIMQRADEETVLSGFAGFNRVAYRKEKQTND